ncbi:hypothetical protein [Actinomadura harenae]|uniref:hypothetical protein n=1 Tax=Actinomadura harenae TaxID=2483351 RepID=UPI0011C3C4AF|nr:hypothetical protein [Actinomadura harenae]
MPVVRTPQPAPKATPLQRTFPIQSPSPTPTRTHNPQPAPIAQRTTSNGPKGPNGPNGPNGGGGPGGGRHVTSPPPSSTPSRRTRESNDRDRRAPEPDLDDLARRLVGPLSRLLRTELRLDRERVGRLRDPRR